MNKPGQKSKFDSLSDAQRAQLISWLCVDRITYKAAQKRIEEKFGLRSSKTALSNFWRRECEPKLLRQYTLQNAHLLIRVLVRQGETILGETNFEVALATHGVSKQRTGSTDGIAFEVATKSPAARQEGKCNS